MKPIYIAIVLVGAFGFFTQAQVTSSASHYTRSFAMTANSKLLIGNFNGPISVRGVDGSVASVTIDLSAPTDEVLHSRDVTVINTPCCGVSGVDRIPRLAPLLSENVAATVPRLVTLYIANISGPVDVSHYEGDLVIKQVNGEAIADTLSKHTEVSQIAGDLRLRLTRTMQSLRVSGVSGSVYLTVPADFDGLIRVNGCSGRFTLDGKARPAASREGSEIRLGTGTATVMINRVSGHVVVSRR